MIENAVRAMIEEPFRAACAVVTVKEGAHEITLHFGAGRSITIIAEAAVVIASTGHRSAATQKTTK